MAASTITPSRAARHAKPKPASEEPPPRSRLRRILRWALWLAIPVMAICAGTVIGVVYALARVPLPDEVPTAQTIVFLDQTGRREIGTLTAQENRRVVPLEKIEEHTRLAVLAAEDRDFYDHGGISWRGLARATAANLLRRRISEGGSTITQQYVKNAFPGVGRDRTLFRKLKEAVIAVKLERKHTKDEILEYYLNTVYFGHGAYGIDAAARTYFSWPANPKTGRPARKVTVEDLKPAQSALLAALIRSPEFYGNEDHRVSLKARRDYILQAMVDRGWLPAKEGSAAIKSKLGVNWEPKRGGIANSQAPHFLEKVRQYLVDKYGAEVVSMGGFRVRTTLDLRMQEQAKRAVQSVVRQGGRNPRAALVAIDPKTGAVRAMYGGSNYVKRQWNYATDSIRQAGSTMKPFVLAQALADGISIQSAFDGPAELEVRGRKYSNYDDVNYGWMNLEEATRLSVNTVYVQLMDKLQNGPERVAELAKRHGLTAELNLGTRVKPGKSPLEKQSVLRPYLPLSLGSGDVTTLQLASAFGTWANRGWHHAPHLVEKVVDSNDRVIEQRDYNSKGVQVIHENQADTINKVLRTAVERGTGTAARLFDRQVAGKTGTTSDYTDARFVGYTPNLVASVWLGYDDPKHKLYNVNGLRAVSGGTLPARIWHNFMVEATRGLPPESFVEPQDFGVVLNPTTTTPPTTVAPVSQPQPTDPPQQQPPPTSLPGPPLTSLPPLPGPGPSPTRP
jgi:penicillin-binding protein 1A